MAWICKIFVKILRFAMAQHHGPSLMNFFCLFHQLRDLVAKSIAHINKSNKLYVKCIINPINYIGTVSRSFIFKLILIDLLHIKIVRIQ